MTAFEIARAALTRVAETTCDGHLVTLAASFRGLPVNGAATDHQLETMEAQLNSFLVGGAEHELQAEAEAKEIVDPTLGPAPEVTPELEVAPEVAPEHVSNADDGASLAAEVSTN